MVPTASLRLSGVPEGQVVVGTQTKDPAKLPETFNLLRQTKTFQCLHAVRHPLCFDEYFSKMPERFLNGTDLMETERLRKFLLPALARRGWTDLSDITNAVFVQRLKMLFEGAMNFTYGSAESPDGEEIIAVFVVKSRLGENGKPVRFIGRAESKVLAFLRAAEEIARDDSYREDLLGR